MNPEVRPYFEAVCREVGALGQGFSLTTLAACHHLARELAGTLPDPGRVATLRMELGLPATQGVTPGPPAEVPAGPQMGLL